MIPLKDSILLKLLKGNKMEITAKIDPKDLGRAIHIMDNILRTTDKKKRKKILMKAAPIFEKELRKNAPYIDIVKRKTQQHHWSFDGIVKRYSSGKVTASYYPGNLKRSIDIIDLKRTTDVWIGAKRSKGVSAKGTFVGFKADGWYMHFLERGTRFQAPQPFLEKTFLAKKSQVSNVLIREYKKEIEKAARK